MLFRLDGDLAILPEGEDLPPPFRLLPSPSLGRAKRMEASRVLYLREFLYGDELGESTVRPRDPLSGDLPLLGERSLAVDLSLPGDLSLTGDRE